MYFSCWLVFSNIIKFLRVGFTFTLFNVLIMYSPLVPLREFINCLFHKEKKFCLIFSSALSEFRQKSIVFIGTLLQLLWKWISLAVAVKAYNQEEATAKHTSRNNRAQARYNLSKLSMTTNSHPRTMTRYCQINLSSHTHGQLVDHLDCGHWLLNCEKTTMTVWPATFDHKLSTQSPYIVDLWTSVYLTRLAPEQNSDFTQRSKSVSFY